MDVTIRGVVNTARYDHDGRNKCTDTAIYDIERVLQDLMRAHPGFLNLGTYDCAQNFTRRIATTMHISTRAELEAVQLPVCQNFQVKGSRSAVAVGFASYDIRAMLDTGMPTARLQ